MRIIQKSWPGSQCSIIAKIRRRKKKMDMAGRSGCCCGSCCPGFCTEFCTVFRQNDIVYAMEQAYKEVKAYHGILSIVETNLNGEETLQQCGRFGRTARDATM